MSPGPGRAGTNGRGETRPAGSDQPRLEAFDPDEALRMIRKRTALVPRTAVVLGSGLGALVEGIAWEATIPTAEIPGLPRSTVPGHAGRLLFGRWSGRPVVVAQGRSHLYEGYTAEEITRTVRLFATLGAKALILTNASGGISRRMVPGMLMLVEDQVNLQGRSPVRGTPATNPRGPDARPVYSPEILERSTRAAALAGVRAERGVLGVMLGPSYETRAEIEMLERMGADAVCMSTAAEVAQASTLGLPVGAISCVANRAAGKGTDRLSHADVTAAIAGAVAPLRSLFERLLISLS